MRYELTHPFRNDTPIPPAPQSGGLWAASLRGPSSAPEQPPSQGPAGTACHSPRASLPSGLRRPGGTQRRDCSPRHRAQPRPDPPLTKAPRPPGPQRTGDPFARLPARDPARCLQPSGSRLPSPVEAGLTAGGSRRRNAVLPEPPRRGRGTGGRLSGAHVTLTRRGSLRSVI